MKEQTPPSRLRFLRSVPVSDGPLDDLSVKHLLPSGGRKYWKKREILYWADQPANTFYKITQGVVAEAQALDDGRRQIVGIRTVGDLCGFPEQDGQHLFTAEAVTDVEVCAFDRDRLYAIAARNADFSDRLTKHASDKLKEASLNVTAITQLKAAERLARFLVEMRNLGLSLEESVQPFVLHLNRQQIADYLGMRLETVSRSFTKLRYLRVIELVETEEVVVIDEEKLLELSKSETFYLRDCRKRLEAPSMTASTARALGRR